MVFFLISWVCQKIQAPELYLLQYIIYLLFLWIGKTRICFSCRSNVIQPQLVLCVPCLLELFQGQTDHDMISISFCTLSFSDVASPHSGNHILFSPKIFALIKTRSGVANVCHNVIVPLRPLGIRVLDPRAHWSSEGTMVPSCRYE